MQHDCSGDQRQRNGQQTDQCGAPVVKEEYRKVNDNIVLLMQLNGTMKGIKFTYYGYYYSSNEGSVQLVTFTATNLFDQQKKDMEEFLNGFVSTKN